MHRPSADRRPQARQRGFTLIEIMVVIVILGLLATMVVPNVLGMSEEAKLTKAQTDVKAIADAIKWYKAKNSKTPTMEDLTTEDEKGFAFLDPAPGNDPWDNAYVIRDLDRGKFEVISWGPDKTEGTGDDISSVPKKDD